VLEVSSEPIKKEERELPNSDHWITLNVMDTSKVSLRISSMTLAEELHSLSSAFETPTSSN